MAQANGPLKVSPTIEFLFPAKESLGLVLDDKFEGVQVATVAGNARKRGVEPGDVITHVNGQPFPAEFRSNHFAALVQKIRETAPLSSISLDVLRVRVTVAEFPPKPRVLGLAFDAGKRTRQTPGLIVAKSSGAAKAKGIEPGDLVLTINGEVIPPKFPQQRFAELLDSIPGAVNLIVVRTGRPFPRSVPKGAGEMLPGKAISPIMQGVVNAVLATGVHHVTGFQPPYAMAISRPLCKAGLSYLAGERDMAKIIGPVADALSSVVFADTNVEAIHKMPPPFALEIANGFQKAVSGTRGGMTGFACAAIAGAALMPNQLCN